MSVSYGASSSPSPGSDAISKPQYISEGSVSAVPSSSATVIQPAGVGSRSASPVMISAVSRGARCESGGLAQPAGGQVRSELVAWLSLASRVAKMQASDWRTSGDDIGPLPEIVT